MKTYEFLCGGDYGAWECTVSVALSNEEEDLLSAYAKENEVLDGLPPLDGIFSKVVSALEEQCDEEIDLNSAVIRTPDVFRRHL